VLFLLACQDPGKPPGLVAGADGDSGDVSADDTARTEPPDLVPTGPDYDGDGYADLAIADPAFGRVYIYAGSEAGVATTPAWVLAGGHEFGARLGWVPDVDGDGGSELVVAEEGAVVVTGAAGQVLWRATNGTAVGLSGSEPLLAMSNSAGVHFERLSSGGRVTLATLAEPVALAVTDLDRDGDDDLLWLDAGALWWVAGPVDSGTPEQIPLDLAFVGDVHVSPSGGVYVLGESVWRIVDPLGRPAFEEWIPSSTPTGLVAADLDGDGTDELAVSTPGGVEVYSRGTIFSHGAGSVAGARDVDADGVLDLLVGRPDADGGGELSAYTGVDGEVPAFTWRTSEPLTGFSRPDVAGPGDLDEDDLADLVVSDGARVMVYAGEAISGTLLTTIDSDGADVASVGDVDGDGWPDLLIAEQGVALSELWTNLYAAPEVLAELNIGRIAGPLGDVNGDGANEIGGWFECACSYPGLLVYAGAALDRINMNFINDVSGRGLAAGDLNDDGYSDIVVTGGSGTLWVWPGAPTLGPETTWVYPAIGGYSPVVPGDFDEDQRPDILVGEAASAGAFVIHLLHVPAAPSPTQLSVPAISGKPVIAPVGDVTGDGVVDVIVGSDTCDVGAQLYLLPGGWDHPEAELLDLGYASVCTPTAVGDTDGDGVIDLTVFTPNGDEYDVYRAHLDGRTEALLPWEDGTREFGAAAG
jgi:hypothetical protein